MTRCSMLLAGLVLAVLTQHAAFAARDAAPLSTQKTVSQYGITWTFDKPVQVGRFVNGDYYVVGPVTVVDIDPPVLVGEEVPKDQIGGRETRWRQRDQAYVRNGSMLNPPARREVAYDSAISNWFRPGMVNAPPIEMKPGDSLVSTISLKVGEKVRKIVRGDGSHPEAEREYGDDSPVKTAAVLTCMAEAQPADAFRPAFCDTANHVYLARNLHRERLPNLPVPEAGFRIQDGEKDMEWWIRVFQRPWVNTGFFGFEQPMLNMPHYGREVGRTVGAAALVLCCDVPEGKKENLLINYVQVGIDYWGAVSNGHPGWHAFGGHGSGRKLPIVIAGYLLDDEKMMAPTKSFPDVDFQEDMQVIYDTGWTGAKVVYSGHLGSPDGKRVTEGPDSYLSYEHLPPSEWKSMTGEGYRRCCTSNAWVAQALAIHILGLEDAWNQPAFLDYADRWMTEDDTEHIKAIKEATGRDFSPDYNRQRNTWDPFVDRMWATHRGNLP